MNLLNYFFNEKKHKTYILLKSDLFDLLSLYGKPEEKVFELVESEDEISSAKSVRSELTIEIRSRANSVEILSSSSSDFESGTQPRTCSIGPASGMIKKHSIKSF